MHFHSPTAIRLLIASTLILATALPAQKQPTQLQIDNRIEAQVHQALTNPVFTGMYVHSSVTRGVVTLSGTATSEAAKELASSQIGSIEGVRSVLNNLNIIGASSQRPAPEPAAPALASGPKVVTLPTGSILAIRISDEIETKTAKVGDIFKATTAAATNVAGFTAIPSGTAVTGRIIDAKAAGHFSGAAQLTVELVSIRLAQANGTQDVSLVTEPLSSKATGRGANTAEKAGGGAAFGAVIGALAGGGTGAGIGAASGGALGLGANAITKGRDIDLKPEQLLQFHTSVPIEVTIMLVNGHQISPPPAISPALQTRPVTSPVDQPTLPATQP